MNRATIGILFFAALSASGQTPQVIATGLQGPQKFILTPRGNFVVSETSTAINSGRVSFVTRGGNRRTMFDKMPSGTEVTGGGSGPTALVLRDRTLYMAIGGGDSERRPTPTSPTTLPNPAGASSPIFTSVLAIRFNLDIDTLSGTFTMTPQIQQQLADGDEVEMSDGSGGTARISLLCDFPDSVPDANIVYRFSNPWGLALTPDGSTLYLTDASLNALIRIDTATGRWGRIMRFAPTPNATPMIGGPFSDAVPTGIRTYGNQLLVSFLSGVPFAQGTARVMAVNPELRTAEPFMTLLTSVTDVLWRPRANSRAQFFILEFSTNQLQSPAPPGRLLRYDTPDPIVMSNELRAPVQLVFDEGSNSVIVLELSGRILEFKL